MHWALLRGRKRLLGDMVKMENLKVIICFEIVPLLELLCKCLMVSLCDELSMTEIFWSRHLIHPQWVEHFRKWICPIIKCNHFLCKGIFQTIFFTFLCNSITFPRISEEIRSLWQGTLLYDYTLKWALHDMAKKAQERLLAYFAALAKIPYWHPGHIPIRRRKLGRQRLWHCRCRHRLCSFFEESENKVHLSRP